MRVSGVIRKLPLLVYFMVVFFSGGGAEAAGSYKIGIKDIISVSIFAGGEQQVAVDLPVSDQGMVNFPFLGSVKAAGMTTSRLEKVISAPLGREYFVNPQVHIRVKEYHSLYFYISGAIKKPGKYEMQAATTLMDLIAKAQGVTAERGNIAYIVRSKGVSGSGRKSGEKDGEDTKYQPVKVNLLKLLDEGDMSLNVRLVPGDSVYIPLAKALNQAASKVYVSGEVKKPDLYEYQPGLTALSVCIMAGGFAKYAAPNRTTIVRVENGEQKVIRVDLEDVIAGKIPDVSLKPGDRIHVPESWL